MFACVIRELLLFEDIVHGLRDESPNPIEINSLAERERNLVSRLPRALSVFEGRKRACLNGGIPGGSVVE